MEQELRILLIDDDEVDRLTVKRSLKSTQFPATIESAETGAEALEILQQQPFDCVFLDFNLPDQNGIELLEKLNEKGIRAPIIMVTSHGDEKLAADSMKAGAMDYISKSMLNPEGLSQSIRNIIRVQIAEEEKRKALLELESSKASLSALIENSQAAIWSLDADYRVIIYNSKCTQEFLYTFQYKIKTGDHLFEHIPKYFVQLWKPMFDRAFQGEKVQEENHYEYKDHAFDLELSINPIRSEDGRINGISVFTWNISERKRAEQRILDSEKRFRQLFEASSVAILVESVESNVILDVNAAACQLHGYSKEDMIGMSIFDTIPPAHLAKSKENYQKYLDGELKLLESYVLHADGSTIPIEIITNEIEYKGQPANLLHMSDITERKKVQEALIKAKEVAEDTARIKQDFLANMSHEIRTPMNAILGFTEVVQNTNLSEEQSNYIHNIQQSAENLLVIINDILDFSKIEAGKMNIEHTNFSLATLLQNLESIFKPQVAEKKIKLLFDRDNRIPQYLEGDPVRINQILINLINNAIKFTHKGYVNVAAELSKQEGDAVTLFFAVEDTGIGIPKEKQKTIFDSFTQAESNTTRQYGGTGLGLSIVKKLVALMGGEISLDSEEGEGSCFSFTIQVKTGSSEGITDPITHVDAAIDLSNTRILLAEDNPMNQTLAIKLLSKYNSTIDVAENGQVALDKVKAQDYDLILMDIQMPVMDGIECTRQIRALDPPKGEIPIMAMTAHALKEELDRCLTVGMNDHITKPFKQKDLYRKITALLQGKIAPLVQEGVANGHPVGTPVSNGSGKITNMAYLEEMSDGSPDFIQEMLTMFIKQSGDAMALFDKGLEQKDFTLIRTVAHKMKPSATFVGIQGLELQLERIERSCANQTDLDEVPAKVLEVKMILEQARAEVQEDLTNQGAI